jgi:transcriptional regulator with XRE-family HTH domain
MYYMEKENQRYLELGDFLKTRRKKLLPYQVGLPEGVRRRTPGLRREEVASLAGIGVTWYTWLEQGRAIRISEAVIESLSRALMLEREEIIHFYALAKVVPPEYIPTSTDTINPILQHLLDSMECSPAFVLNSRWNIIAWNKAACAVFADFSIMENCDRNLIWLMFTSESYKKLFPDWEIHARGMLARFRSSLGNFIEDPWILQFVEKVKLHSVEFDELWPRHEIEDENEMYKKIDNPIVGRLNFEYSSFQILDNHNFKLLVNTPAPDTDTAEKVNFLLCNQNKYSIQSLSSASSKE